MNQDRSLVRDYLTKRFKELTKDFSPIDKALAHDMNLDAFDLNSVKEGKLTPAQIDDLNDVRWALDSLRDMERKVQAQDALKKTLEVLRDLLGFNELKAIRQAVEGLYDSDEEQEDNSEPKPE